MNIGTLHPLAPYNFARSAALMHRYHGVLDLWHDDTYYRVLSSVGEPALVRVRADQTALPVALLHGNPNDAPRILAAVGRILCVQEDFAAFYQMASTHPVLAEVVRRLDGLHHFQSETVFEALVMVIIEQQISLRAALRAQAALSEWSGVAVTHNGIVYRGFPSVTQLATADPEALHTVLKITHRRIALIQQVARAIEAGTLNLETLRGADPTEAYRTLIAINGIGHWTVAWTLIRGASSYPYAGHNDVALRDAVADYFYDVKQRVPAQFVDETFAQFAPYSGLAAFYTLMRWATEHY